MLLLGLAGCDFYVPQSTKTNAETSDGVSGEVGVIYVGNAVLIASGDEANLVVSLVNQANQDVRLKISHGTPQVTDTVLALASATTQLGGAGEEQVTLTGFDAEPGSLYPMYFQYGDETGLRLSVPVLTDAQPQYQDLGP